MRLNYWVSALTAEIFGTLGIPGRNVSCETASALVVLSGVLMRKQMSPPADSADVHLVEDDFGTFGIGFVETDTSDADRETIIRNFISGQYNRPLRVVSFNVGEGWCRDVSEDIAIEVLQRAADTERDLPEATMAFINRHGGLGKKPPAPSVASRSSEDEPASDTDRRSA
jgi:hypothetical protein